MGSSRWMRFGLCGLLCGLAFGMGSGFVPSSIGAEPLGAHYGFLPPEVYKLDFRVQNLLSVDLNGNGKNDLLIVNNAKNRLDVLEQREPGEVPEEPESLDVNEIPPDTRMRLRKIPITRAVQSLDVGDLNSDGKPDLAYLGEPSGLYIQYQDDKGDFSRTRQFSIDDALASGWALSIGDVNNDGRNDVAFLGRMNLYIALQNDEGMMEPPKRFRHAADGPSLIRVLDMNEDGRKDVVYLSQDQQFPIVVRFQNEQGRLGPERRFEADPLRAVAYANVDGKPGQEVLAISSLTGRMLAYGIAESENSDAAPTGQMVIFPFEKGGSNSSTSLVTGDIDGDGRLDVLVSDADGARFQLYRQSVGSGLDVNVSFPAMLGTTSLRLADINGDNKLEVLSLSEQERSIGVCEYSGTRLSYPRTLPISDEPNVMEVIGSGAGARLAYIARRQDPMTRRDLFTLRLLKPEAKDDSIEWKKLPIGDKEELELKLDAKPVDLKTVDANGDGKTDLLLFFLFQAPVLLVGGDNNAFAEAASGSQGTIGEVSSAAYFFGMLDQPKPVVVFGQNNFARRVSLGPDGRWKVDDQYNSGSASARIIGVEALDLDGDGSPELAMYDRSTQTIYFLKSQEGIYRRWKDLKVASFDLRGTQVGDFNADGKDDLLFYDGDKMGIAYTGRKDLELKLVASYETRIPNGNLLDVVPGDLNGDSALDLLLLEPVKKHFEVIAVKPDGKLERAIYWKVFEEKTFRRQAPGIDPRESIIADVNADGRNDIIALVHDRVLIYLQDTGVRPASAVAKRPEEKDKDTATP
jgi:hypothetical protein